MELPNEIDVGQASTLLKQYKSINLQDLDELPDELDVSEAQKLLPFLRQFKQQSSSGATKHYSGTVGNAFEPTDLPLQGRISQGFGAPVDYEKSGRHGGIDIAVPTGTPLPSNVSGIVAGLENNEGGYGMSLIIQGDDGITRRYSHLSEVAVKPGARVDKGVLLGKTGNTGHSTGPHLDYRTYRIPEKKKDDAGGPYDDELQHMDSKKFLNMARKQMSGSEDI